MLFFKKVTFARVSWSQQVDLGASSKLVITPLLELVLMSLVMIRTSSGSTASYLVGLSSEESQRLRKRKTKTPKPQQVTRDSHSQSESKLASMDLIQGTKKTKRKFN
jgi:hypothetical protein